MASLLDRLNLTLFTIGDNPITVSTILVFLGAVLALVAVSRAIQRWLVGRLLARSHLDASTRQTVGTLVHYAVLVFGFMAIMQTVGIDLTALSVLAGAVGVGIGFGLQNIVSNFISGLIVMFERPVRIGDRIELGGFEGDVISINARTTTLRTNRGAKVIVPNQKFITEFVRNWDVGTYGGNRTSLIVPVKAAREHDPALVEQLLTEAAAAQPQLLQDPPPVAYLVAADAAGYAFELQAWTATGAVQRAQQQGALVAAVQARLAGQGVKLV